MPAQAQNGSSNKTGVTLEMNDGETFLFTSESVGEGHPGMAKKIMSRKLLTLKQKKIIFRKRLILEQKVTSVTPLKFNFTCLLINCQNSSGILFLYGK